MIRRQHETEEQQDTGFDAMLDHALRLRSQAGPRAGFHHRLAESLRQASDRGSRGPWWRSFAALLPAAILAMAVAAAVVTLHRHPGHLPRNSAQVAKNVVAAHQAGEVFAMASAARPARRPGDLRSGRRPDIAKQPAVAKQAGTVVAAAMPKLATFPSTAQDATHPFGSGDPVQPVSPEAARAMLGLQQEQAAPITLTAINLNRPLFGENQ